MWIIQALSQIKGVVEMNEINNETVRGSHSPAVMELARILYEKMEHLDPGSCGGSEWAVLPAKDVELYALCVEELIENASLVIRALADYDVVLRHPKLPKKVY